MHAHLKKAWSALLWYWQWFWRTPGAGVVPGFARMELPANSVCLPRTALPASGRGLWGGKAPSSGSPGGWEPNCGLLSILCWFWVPAVCLPWGKATAAPLGVAAPAWGCLRRRKMKVMRTAGYREQGIRGPQHIKVLLLLSEPGEQPGQCSSGQEPPTGHWDCLQDTLNSPKRANKIRRKGRYLSI